MSPRCAIPPLSPARGYEGTAASQIHARYEDVTQDGRVQLTTLAPGLGAVWRSLGTAAQLASFRDNGILPILRRLVIRGEVGPFSVHVPLQVSGTWRLARERGGDRLFMNMWIELKAPIASTLAPPPPKDAERALVGRVYAEHVITKPFAPAAERKVTRLSVPGLPEMPEDEHAFEDASELLDGRALSAAGEHVFGMMHTDSNQHVNSLVYPRVLEERLVQVLADRKDIATPANLLARAIEVRYRKPFFAGDRAEIALDVTPTEGGAVAVGAFSPAGEPAKPSCTAAVWLA